MRVTGGDVLWLQSKGSGMVHIRWQVNLRGLSFAAAGPRLWKSLSVQLRNPDINYRLFRRQLKGHLFGNHGHGAL